MIVEFLCDIFFWICHFLVSLFPQFPSFEQLNISLSPIFYVLKLINQFVSLPVVGNCLVIILLVYNIKFVWSILMWLIRKIPGVS